MKNDINDIDTVRVWLREKLLGLLNVQNCLLPRGSNSLVVRTWTGVVINIYLLDAPVSTRAIKRLLAESSEISIGSLFIVHDSLVPTEGTRFEPKEWLRALHTITRERIYTYRVVEGTPHLAQLHLEPIANTGEYGVKYGPPIQFERLRYFRIDVRPRYIRGDWHVADFGFHAFWRDPYRSHEPRYRRPDDDRERRYTAWRAWSQTSWEGPQSEAIPEPARPQDKLAVCYQMLDISPEASREEIKAAFRKLAISYHPDTSELPHEEAVLKFRQITEAYETIKASQDW